MADFDVERACRGMKIVHSTERYRSGSNSIACVLQDLMHYAIHNGINFDKELGLATKFFDEDRASGFTEKEGK